MFWVEFVILLLECFHLVTQENKEIPSNDIFKLTSAKRMLVIYSNRH
jgi:hypothetical protein